ncbi:MAG: hypothetical protein BGO78_13995 [Chloroflexi bacterium 44-23]|nr:MAG: hypothetical protein BGO78_13995 [Chloroflexi bacterium 44-23]
MHLYYSSKPAAIPPPEDFENPEGESPLLDWQGGEIIYTYDGDGNLVKSEIGEVTTYYPSQYYEKRMVDEEQTIFKYYFVGSARIAVRENGTLSWLLSDHLGSTSGTVNAAGALVSTMKYTAFGETRGTGSSTTDYRYTGQREEEEIGLYFYKARFYDPALARFVQADTLIPIVNNVLDWDRYAYTNNNPAKYTDSSGHCIDGVTTAICIALAAGAIAGYAIQVGENRAQGMDWGEALTTNISGEKILAGAVIGGGIIVAAAAASVGLAAVGITAGAACADGDCTNEAGGVTTAVSKVADSVDDIGTPNYPPGTFSIRDWSGYP